MSAKSRTVILFAGVAVLVATLGLLRISHGDDTTGVELERWEERVAEAATQGGFVIQQGMKPAVAALGSGRDAPVAVQAVGWVNQLRQVRDAFASSGPPPALAEAAAGFDAALGLYIDAAERIGAAGMAAGETRAKVLDDAVAVARRADARWDRASATLQRVRRDHGLEPTTRFPDR